jgi:hypothetical protein
MPRYIFSLSDGRSVIRAKALELADAATARKEAAIFARQLGRDAPGRLRVRGDVVVTDADGREVLSVAVPGRAAAPPGSRGHRRPRSAAEHRRRA